MNTDSYQRALLLVEDNAADLELTFLALRRNQFANEIVVATDGAEALDYLYRRRAFADRAEGNPGLMLLDLKMAHVDGLEVLRTVKRDPELRSIPVVMLSSSHHDKDVSTSYDLGVNAYMVKPVDFQQFVHAMKVLVGFWDVVEPPPTRRPTES